MAGFILFIPLIILIISGTDSLETDQSYCPFKMITGLPCPGCGMVKSMVFFYVGDLPRSFKYHIFGPFIILVSVAIILILLYEVVTNSTVKLNLLYSTKFAYILAAILIVFHLVRLIVFISTNSWNEILQESIWR